MKKIVFFFLLLFLSINLFSEQVDFIVAKVGREIILLSDLMKQINQMKSAQMWNDNITETDVLVDMIENKLIIQKARELNIRIDEKRINTSAEAQLNQVKTQFPTEDDFFRELRNAGLLQSDLRRYYQEMFTENFLKEKLIQTEIRSRINLTDSDIYDFYLVQRDSLALKPETYEIAMILRIPGPSQETEREALKKIELIQKKISQGEDFATLAMQFSECPSSQMGGDLNYFTRGMMVKEFEDAAFKLQINQVSPIIKTSFGYHLIKLTDKKDDEIRASHILVMLNESPDDIERERLFINNLHSKLVNGTSFDSLAFVYSHDEDSKSKYGVIGTLTTDEFPQWFSSEITALGIGEFTDVLEYQNMFYIFRKNRSFDPRPLDFNEVRSFLREVLMRKRQMQLYEQWMENLKKEIYVHIYEDRLNVFK